MTFGKKIAFWGTLAALLYVLLSYHFIFEKISLLSPPQLLKKSKLTLNNTFVSLHGKSNEAIVAMDDLREDGIADLLVEMGRLSEEQKELLMYRYEKDETN
jgi:hypothetical protein